MGTLQPQSNGPISNTVIGTLAVDGWTVTCRTARRGLGGLRPCPDPHRCTKCNSRPINGQCTNFILFDVALSHSKGLTWCTHLPFRGLELGTRLKLWRRAIVTSGLRSCWNNFCGLVIEPKYVDNLPEVVTL